MSELPFGMTSVQAAQAHTALEKLDDIVALAKKNRLNNVLVYKMPRDEYKPDFAAPVDAPLDVEWILGSSRYVFSRCVEKGLNPTVVQKGWSAELYIEVHW